MTPSLPAGLSIDASTGAISGTPTSLATRTTYTVTAQNAGGQTTAGVSIIVNDVAPLVAYQSPYCAFSLNVAGQVNAPTASGGAVVSWGVSPPLPAGLTLSQTDGSISGTPTAAVAAATYMVTATNSGGQSKVPLTLAVGPAPVLDLGHTSGIVLIRSTGTAVLSSDEQDSCVGVHCPGRWVAQNYASGAILASGGVPACVNPFICGAITHPAVDLAGNTMIEGIPDGKFMYSTGQVVSATSGVEIRSASTGELLGTISGQFWWYQLASDGSYVVTASDTSLTAYTTAGQVLFSLPGYSRTAIAFSSPTAIQIAYTECPGDPPDLREPRGLNVIETISVATGKPTASAPFQGQFNSWFPDGLVHDAVHERQILSAHFDNRSVRDRNFRTHTRVPRRPGFRIAVYWPTSAPTEIDSRCK